MEEKRTLFRKGKRADWIQLVIRVILFLAPFAVGIAGNLSAEKPLLDSVFASMTYYVLNNAETPVNIWQEIARFSAPVVMAGSILSLVTERFSNWIKCLLPGAVAVYGNTPEAEYILRQLGVRGIKGHEEFVRAAKYIFAVESGDSQALYSSMKARLRKKRYFGLKERDVFLWNDHEIGFSAETNTRLFNPENDAARVYWQERCLYETAAEKGFQPSVCIIGFDSLGQDLLLQALQLNVFDRKQKIDYHVFGNYSMFQQIHHELNQIPDKVHYHDEPWYGALNLLSKADRIIMTEEESTLEQLLLAVPAVKVDYFTDEFTDLRPQKRAGGRRDETACSEQQGRVWRYYWKSEALDVKKIFSETVTDNAKRHHLKYENVNRTREGQPPIQDTRKNRDRLWQGLSMMDRQSNIAVSDYQKIQLKMLEARGITIPELMSSKDLFEEFAELEHMRWMRFYYARNWKKGDRTEGERAYCRHWLLIHYVDLEEDIKEYDRINIRLLSEPEPGEQQGN